MRTTSILALASAAAVTGVTTLALAGPAAAQHVADPRGGGVHGTKMVVTTDNPANTESDWLPIGAGAVGGLALAGAGVALVGVERRHRHNAKLA